jgi:hypothetical protein
LSLSLAPSLSHSHIHVHIHIHIHIHIHSHILILILSYKSNFFERFFLIFGVDLRIEVIQRIESGVIEAQAQSRIVIAIVCVTPFLEGSYPLAQISFVYVSYYFALISLSKTVLIRHTHTHTHTHTLNTLNTFSFSFAQH